MYEDADEGTQNTEEEARKEVRWIIPVHVVVRGRLDDGTAFEEEGTTEDVSPSGMAVFLPTPVRKGSRIEVLARAEGFESPAIVTHARAMGPSMHRIRLRFEGAKKYERKHAPRKFIYDASASRWVGYLEGGVYYNHKHEAFGKLQGAKVFSIDTNQEMFIQKQESFYDLRGNFVGQLI